MATKSPPKVGTPDIDDKMDDTSSPVSPQRKSNITRDPAPGAPPGRHQALAEVSANATRTSSAKVTTKPAATTSSSAPTKAPSGVMRTQRRTHRHNPLERHIGNPYHEKKKVTKQGTNQQNNISDIVQTQAQAQSQDQPYEDGLDGVEASTEDLVPRNANDDRRHWASEIPNLLRDVKQIACGLDAVRGIHDNTEDGLMFLARGMEFD
ncbi:hypothetical protein F5B19DRAFT_495466 [Rostrohypoxylon terebratum]|nr:hypothetical protein F5B19DRAFT_495466 [Rostrohypoxylon terebratum]